MVLKRMLLSIVVVGMFCSAAFALAPMGPPMAGLPQGSHSVGVGYAYSDMTVEVSGPVSGAGGEKVLNDLQTNMYYLCLGYGISDDWNVYGGIGATDSEFPGDASAKDFEGHTGFAFGIGTKRTLAEDGDTKWGVLCQYTHGKSDDNVRGVSGSGNDTWGNGSISIPDSGAFPAKLEYYEVQIAVGPTIPLSEDVCVYGGPFLHFLEGDLEVKDGSNRREDELEQNFELGAYIGALINLGDPNASLMAELLYTDSGWGIGIGAMIRCP